MRKLLCLVDGSEVERLVRMKLMREGEFEEREVVPISLLGRMKYGDEDNVLCGYIFLIPFNYHYPVMGLANRQFGIRFSSGCKLVQK